MVSPLTVLRTIRHLTPRQVAHQLIHRVNGPAQRPEQVAVHGCTGLALEGWTPPSSEGQCDEGGRRVTLLGEPPHDPMAAGWEPPRGPLWLYTLHYHGWINRPEADPALIRALLLHWIDNHPCGVGWEPYPTAMRLLHWIGWLSRHEGGLGGNQRRWIFGSLAAQLVHLERHLERHLDGNHLWTDLAALATAGVALSGPLPARLAERWPAAFAGVVADQLAEDGVHGERTPTYHCLLAEQLAGVVRAMTLRTGAGSPLVNRLDDALQGMTRALPTFTHPDGDVALFGDSQRDAPVTPAGLARRLGFALPSGDADAATSGFHRRSWGPFTLLWNLGRTGLDRQVGHVHADALGFELSLRGERVIVDAGVGTYVPGPERDYARGTAAHNTVTLGADDQHELWASHRIGGRARVGVDEVSARRLAGWVIGHRAPTRHSRALEWSEGAIRCRDELADPQATTAIARYHVPADAEVVAIERGFRITSAGGARFTITGPEGVAWTREPVAGWLAIGRPAPRIALCAALPASGLGVQIRAEA
ncbi:MAG: heparinase II/III-family protein [Myxococcales bacterium]|nr:heparinase II/III-family protein [Myxococcales bacterium]